MNNYPLGFQQDNEGDFIYKDVNAVKSYRINWTNWLNGEDTIASVQWFVATGITAESTAFTDTDATIRLSGGTAKQNYNVTCRITTVNGQIEDKSFRVVVVNI